MVVFIYLIFLGATHQGWGEFHPRGRGWLHTTSKGESESVCRCRRSIRGCSYPSFALRSTCDPEVLSYVRTRGTMAMMFNARLNTVCPSATIAPVTVTALAMLLCSCEVTSIKSNAVEPRNKKIAPSSSITRRVLPARRKKNCLDASPRGFTDTLDPVVPLELSMVVQDNGVVTSPPLVLAE